MVAITNTCGKALNISACVSNSTWIIDFGAIYHMTIVSTQIAHLKLSIQKNISTANGNESSVIGTSLFLTNTLNLDSVSVVPSLNYNLLYVSQITRALTCRFVA